VDLTGEVPRHLLDLLAGQRLDVVAWHRPGGAGPRTVDGVRWEAVELLEKTSVREANSLRKNRTLSAAGDVAATGPG
jgi:hypothetical protein